MDSESNKRVSESRIDLSTEKKPSTQFLTKFIIELLHFVVVVVPLIVYSIISNFLLQPKSVKDKVVLVTGSGRGLGRGMAEKFAELGSLVACVDIDEGSNQETVKRINEGYPEHAKSYTCNVAKMADVKKLEEAVKKDFGRVDILINNAGIIAGSSFTDQDEDFINKVIGVNLMSHFYMIHAFLPDMIERNAGHIVAVSSMTAFSSHSKCSLYTATKSAVSTLMEGLYYELKDNPRNAIKTSVICPTFINTNEFYTQQWNLRVPPMSVKEAIEAAVDGIRKERRVFTIPLWMYYGLHIMKFLPDSVNDLIKEMFYIKLTIPSTSIQKNRPVFQLLSQSTRAVGETISK